MVFSLFYIFIVFVALCHKIFIEELLVSDIPLDFHVAFFYVSYAPSKVCDKYVSPMGAISFPRTVLVVHASFSSKLLL